MKIRLTRQMLLDARTEAGGFTKAQTDALGIQYPPQQGWLASLVGTEIEQAKFKEFLAARNIRAKKSPPPNNLELF